MMHTCKWTLNGHNNDYSRTARIRFHAGALCVPALLDQHREAKEHKDKQEQQNYKGDFLF